MTVDPLEETYERLFKFYGPQGWWPAGTAFEVAVGAVLTQNTNWQNVERAIANLKREKALSARAISAMRKSRLARLIRPAGYFNVKAGRLKALVGFIVREHGGSMRRMAGVGTALMRERLLSVHGVGPETADSILLYALGKPVFVVDAYTKRVLSRHGLAWEGISYAECQGLFHRAFPARGANPGEGEMVPFFNEYHALFVRVGKERCRPRAPLCGGCPLEGLGRGRPSGGPGRGIKKLVVLGGS